MEREFIAWLHDRLPSRPQVALGVGDDAAVLQLSQAQCVVTTDMLMDGVHFRLDECGARNVGHKAVGANLSDLAAMAARPTAMVVSLALPRLRAKEIAIELYEGMAPLADQFGAAIAGGDTNCWDGPLVVNIALFGEPTEHGVLLRSGARPGDWIITTGRFGGSILGRQFTFEPRVSEALLLNERYELHAAADVSDGLVLDLVQIAEASGCGAELEIERTPISDDAVRLADQLDDGASALDHALSDGEDFELILAAPPNSAEQMLREQPLDVELTKIGEFVPGQGLWRTTAGGRQPISPQGFEH